MNRLFVFLVIGLFYSVNPNFVNAQDSLNRFSVEIDFRLVPVIRSFYNDYDFYNIESEQNNSSILITHSPNNFRTSYSARVNISAKNENVIFGIAAKYSRSTNYGKQIYHPDSTFSMLMTENLVSDYIGGNFRIMMNPTKLKFLKHGVTVGGGVLSGRNNVVSLAYKAEEISAYDLGYKVRLYDLYLNYTFQFLFKVGKRTTLFTGFEIPLLRLFFYNSQTKLGLSLNDESFFTSFDSYVPHIGNQLTANKNFAYSLKKTNSLSLNFGIRYYFN